MLVYFLAIVFGTLHLVICIEGIRYRFAIFHTVFFQQFFYVLGLTNGYCTSITLSFNFYSKVVM